ncbi:MAG: hypothetical protein M0Z84_01835 [Gammaproteobacteria bacterium]|nr:hypothetical protein [Gammaproteobacteria bacterium]
MKFLQLIEQLSMRIGQHQLPVNTAAVDIRTLVDSSALHYELAAGIVRAIYARNGCCRLNDPVTAQPTFEALGPIRAGLLGSHRTDVDAYRFMEELCAAVAKIFDARRTAAALDDTSPSETPAQQRGELISLDAVRRRVKSLA